MQVPDCTVRSGGKRDRNHYLNPFKYSFSILSHVISRMNVSFHLNILFCLLISYISNELHNKFSFSFFPFSPLSLNSILMSANNNPIKLWLCNTSEMSSPLSYQISWSTKCFEFFSMAFAPIAFLRLAMDF